MTNTLRSSDNAAGNDLENGAVTPSDVTAPPSSLQVEGAVKAFGDVFALRGVDLTVAPGEFVTLLGPSGCGKSTLLRIIAGIESPTGGVVRVGGRLVNDPVNRVLVPPEKRALGMVFQSYAVWPHMTVARNVAFPLKYQKVPRAARAEMVEAALDLVQMGVYADRYPHQLSGGQQQRVALARALVARPTLLLLDEPLSNLDARLREDLRVELKRLHLELGLSMLYVTHDQSEALAMSDRILVMDAGNVLQEGSPEEVYRCPETLQVARFLGIKTVLPGTAGADGVVDIQGFRLPARYPTAVAEGSPVSVAVPSDAFVELPVEHPNGLVGTIELVEFLGSSYEHEIRFGPHRLTVLFARPLGQRGDEVTLGFSAEGASAFPAEPETPIAEPDQ
jgi:iron(III) transport system ATP-binding protein